MYLVVRIFGVIVSNGGLLTKFPFFFPSPEARLVNRIIRKKVVASTKHVEMGGNDYSFSNKTYSIFVVTCDAHRLQRLT